MMPTMQLFDQLISSDLEMSSDFDLYCNGNCGLNKKMKLDDLHGITNISEYVSPLVISPNLSVNVDCSLSSLSANKASFIWPAAFSLSKYLSRNSNLVIDKVVLELGCGIGLPSIVAAKLGAKEVFLTDADVSFAIKSLRLNSVTNASCVTLFWGVISSALNKFIDVDIILAADCFYESHQFEPLVKTVAFIVHQNQGKDVKFVFSQPLRDNLKNIRCLLNEYNLKGELLQDSDDNSCQIFSICSRV